MFREFSKIKAGDCKAKRSGKSLDNGKVDLDEDAELYRDEIVGLAILSENDIPTCNSTYNTTFTNTAAKI